jgi:N-acetylmuramoyl-L-alanine amidase
MATICIDPGHGGTRKVGGSSPNNATGPPGTKEKALTLVIGLAARDVLSRRGHTVFVTRASDVNLVLGITAE